MLTLSPIMPFCLNNIIIASTPSLEAQLSMCSARYSLYDDKMNTATAKVMHAGGITQNIEREWACLQENCSKVCITVN